MFRVLTCGERGGGGRGERRPAVLGAWGLRRARFLFLSRFRARKAMRNHTWTAKVNPSYPVTEDVGNRRVRTCVCEEIYDKGLAHPTAEETGDPGELMVQVPIQVQVQRQKKTGAPTQSHGGEGTGREGERESPRPSLCPAQPLSGEDALPRWAW